MVINFPNHLPRKVHLKENLYTTGRQLATGAFKSVAATLMKHQGMRDALYEEACDGVNKEIKDLCSIWKPSLLRTTSAEDLACITWEKINSELKDKANRFHQFLKKVGFQRLSSLYHSMGYKATNTMFEKFGKDFDKDLKVWKETVEKDSKKEKSLIEKEMKKNTLKPKLSCRTIGMHPGYSFTGDNVDIRCKPRQMTMKNRNKDHHMFQLVAFQNSVSESSAKWCTQEWCHERAIYNIPTKCGWAGSTCWRIGHSCWAEVGIKYPSTCMVLKTISQQGYIMNTWNKWRQRLKRYLLIPVHDQSNICFRKCIKCPPQGIYYVFCFKLREEEHKPA